MPRRVPSVAWNATLVRQPLVGFTSGCPLCGASIPAGLEHYLDHAKGVHGVTLRICRCGVVVEPPARLCSLCDGVC